MSAKLFHTACPLLNPLNKLNVVMACCLVFLLPHDSRKSETLVNVSKLSHTADLILFVEFPGLLHATIRIYVAMGTKHGRNRRVY